MTFARNVFIMGYKMNNPTTEHDMSNRRTEARRDARAELEVNWTDETSVMAIAEVLDSNGFGDLAFSSVMGAARAAARELGRLADDNETITAKVSQ